MKCLRCESVEMEIEARGDQIEFIDSFEIDICPECKGIWLDANELKFLDSSLFIDVEHIEYTETAPTTDDTAVSCPKCETQPTLTKCHPKGHKDVVIDTCPNCKGFWLDKGEMEKLHDISDELLLASLLPLD